MRSRYLQLVVGGLWLLVVAAISTGESTRYTGPSLPVDAAFFGMHIHHAADDTVWPAIPFADWRLWDAGVSWPQLEPAPGKWNFTLLDRYAQLAANRHVEILLTLGLTPTWASARPDEPSAYRNGNAAEPRRLSDWEDYVRTIATRYKGAIHSYEIWNEVDVKGTFTGNTQTMLELSRSAYRILKSIDPTVIVVSPSATTADGLPWLEAFLQQGGCQFADVIGYHFYVTPHPPEEMIALIQQVKTSLRHHGCENKPLWNTESGWAKPTQFTSEEEAAGYLMRTYLLNWLMGIRRCYWYAWDNHNWSTLELTSPESTRMTRVGAAYGVLHGWVDQAVLHSCQRGRSGIWACQLDRAGSTSRVLWSDRGEQPFAIPSSWHVVRISTWTGGTIPTTPQLTLGPAPLLLTGN